jgi:hypothetical protein
MDSRGLFNGQLFRRRNYRLLQNQRLSFLRWTKSACPHSCEDNQATAIMGVFVVHFHAYGVLRRIGDGGACFRSRIAIDGQIGGTAASGKGRGPSMCISFV